MVYVLNNTNAALSYQNEFVCWWSPRLHFVSSLMHSFMHHLITHSLTHSLTHHSLTHSIIAYTALHRATSLHHPCPVLSLHCIVLHWHHDHTHSHINHHLLTPPLTHSYNSRHTRHIREKRLHPPLPLTHPHTHCPTRPPTRATRQATHRAKPHISQSITRH